MEYTVKNQRGEVVDSATDAPHAKYAAILKREATGETFEVYDPDGEFVSRHGEAEAKEANRIARSSAAVDKRMRAGR